ncbi:MAG: FAD-dependent oxidoreductase [Cellvibrionaceae bacterium]|nr:FAD-dependent oxidoreductase [Cellvibrionaceae bacterium]
MANILIIGGGLGGISCAYEMRAELGKEHHITVIGDRSKFSFNPSNPWVAVGWRKPDDVQIDIAKFLAKKKIGFEHSGLNKIDPDAKTCTLGSGETLPYDYLVITTGPRLAFDEVPGLGPSGHTVSVCTTEHALSAWEDYQEFVKNPGPIIVGAAAGASCFGPAYEFAMILDADLRKRKIRDQVPITYVSSEPYVGHMGLGGVGDSKGMMERELRQRHINWVVNAKIEEVTDGLMKVQEMDKQGEPFKTHEIPFKYSMVLPAFTGVDPVREIKDMCNPRGFVMIDKHQRNPTYPEIFSAGVCVAIPPVEVTPVPTGAPKTGFMIESMVTAICKNIAAELEGKELQAQATWNAICLADMGDTGAAFVALPQIPPRNVTWAKTGKWVHLAKIGFEKYFMRKMKTGSTEPLYEKTVLKALGIERLK